MTQTQARHVGERLLDELRAGIDPGWRCFRGGAPDPNGIGRAWLLSPTPLPDPALLAAGIELPGPTLHLGSSADLYAVVAYLFRTEAKGRAYHGPAWDAVEAAGRAALARADRERSWAIDVDAKDAAARDALVDALARGAAALGVALEVEPWYSGDSPSLHFHFATHRGGPDVGRELGAGVAAICEAGGLVEVKSGTWAHPDHDPAHAVDVLGAFGAAPDAQPRILRAKGGLHKSSGARKRRAFDLDGRWPGVGVAGSPADLIALGQRRLEARAAWELRRAEEQRQRPKRERCDREERPLADLGPCDLPRALAWASEIAAAHAGHRDDLRRALSAVLLLLGLRPRDVRRVVGAASGSEKSRRHGLRLTDGAARRIAANRRAGLPPGLGLPGFGKLRRLVGAAQVARLAVALGRDTGRATLHLGRRLLGRARADRDRALARRARAQADAAAAIFGRDSDGYRHAIAVAVCGAAEQAVSYVNDWHDDEAPQERGAWLERCKRIACPACWGYFVEAASNVFRATLEAHERAADPLGWSLAQLRFRSLEDAHHARERLVAAMSSAWLAWAVTYDGAGGALLTIWCDRPTMAGTLARDTVADRAHYRYLAYRPEVVFTADDVTIPRLADHVAGALYVHHGVARDALLREGVERWAEVAAELKKGHTVGHTAAFSWPTRDAVAADAKARVDEAEDPPEGYSRRYTLRRAADGRHLADSDHPLTIQDAARHLRRVASEVETPWDDPSAAGAFEDDAQRALDRLRAHLELTTGPPG